MSYKWLVSSSAPSRMGTGPRDRDFVIETKTNDIQVVADIIKAEEALQSSLYDYDHMQIDTIAKWQVPMESFRLAQTKGQVKSCHIVRNNGKETLCHRGLQRYTMIVGSLSNITCSHCVKRFSEEVVMPANIIQTPLFEILQQWIQAERTKAIAECDKERDKGKHGYYDSIYEILWRARISVLEDVLEQMRKMT